MSACMLCMYIQCIYIDIYVLEMYDLISWKMAKILRMSQCLSLSVCVCVFGTHINATLLDWICCCCSFLYIQLLVKNSFQSVAKLLLILLLLYTKYTPVYKVLYMCMCVCVCTLYILPVYACIYIYIVCIFLYKYVVYMSSLMEPQQNFSYSFSFFISSSQMATRCAFPQVFSLNILEFSCLFGFLFFSFSFVFLLYQITYIFCLFYVVLLILPLHMFDLIGFQLGLFSQFKLLSLLLLTKYSLDWLTHYERLTYSLVLVVVLVHGLLLLQGILQQNRLEENKYD